MKADNADVLLYFNPIQFFLTMLTKTFERFYRENESVLVGDLIVYNVSEISIIMVSFEDRRYDNAI